MDEQKSLEKRINKPFSELSSDEKIEVLRNEILNLQNTLAYVHNSISAFQSNYRQFQTHSHEGGKVVIPVENAMNHGLGIGNPASTSRKNPLL